MRRILVSLVVAALGALIGPRVGGPRDHAAGTPFVYTPPDGFVAGAGKEAGDAQVWVLHEATDRGPLAVEKSSAATRAILHHSPKEMSVEEVDLGALAGDMAKVFEESCTWVHRRHEMRVRSDGARVGLIEGDCHRDVDLSALGLPPQKIRHRKLQLIFPDDSGTSIVTASYPSDQAARWEPVFEATISKARGVATRVPPPPPWSYAAWAAAGAVVGWLATALVRRRAPSSPRPAGG